MSNKPALIITAVVALLAVAAVIFTIILLGSDNKDADNPPSGAAETADGNNGEPLSENTGEEGEDEFVPSEELKSEVLAAAELLVQDNFEVFELFYLEDYDRNTHFKAEPFGNPSEDGYRTLKPGVIEYDTVAEIFALVDATYVESVAATIKGYSTQTADGSPVYKDRDGGIGVNETYAPKVYDLVWTGDVEIKVDPFTETEWRLSVSPLSGGHTSAPESGEVGEDDQTTIQLLMLKCEDGRWRLENIFY